jgi:hypothetical protein
MFDVLLASDDPRTSWFLHLSGSRDVDSDVQTSLYTEDRGIQVPMTMEHVNIVGTQCCDKIIPHLIRPDFPSIEARQLDRGFQVGSIRPVRVDHTDFFQVTIKTHSFRWFGGISPPCLDSTSPS